MGIQDRIGILTGCNELSTVMKLEIKNLEKMNSKAIIEKIKNGESLKGIDLKSVNFESAYLGGAYLRGANLKYAVLKSVTHTEQKEIIVELNES